MKQLYKKRIIKIISFIIIIFFIDQGIGLTFNKLRNDIANFPCVDSNKGMYAMKKVPSDIVMIGSSEVSRGYNTAIVEKELNLSCYNLGRPQIGFWWEYMAIQGLFTRYTPKILIWDIDLSSISQDIYAENGDITFIAQYMGINSIADSIINSSLSLKAKYFSQSYRSNSFLLDYIKILISSSNKQQDTKGFFDQQKNMLKGNHLEKSSLPTHSNTTSFEMYKFILSQCQSRGCKVYCVLSPKYQIYTNYPSLPILQFKTLCDSLDCPFIDMLQSQPFFEHPEWFQESWHLNSSGAQEFTSMLCDSIKSYETKDGK